MNKSELQELARFGVRYKLVEVQRYLASMFKQFPEEFTTTAAPVFLKPETKGGGNSWPAFTLALPDTNGDTPAPSKRQWSPEARAAAAARLRQRFNNHQSSTEWGSVLWHRVHDDLLAQPDHTSRMVDLSKRLKSLPSSVRSAATTHQKMFRIRHGMVQLIKPMKGLKTIAAGANGSRPQKKPFPSKRQPAHKWGDKVWQEMHDFLAEQPEHTAPLQAIMKKVRTKVHATVLSAVKLHPDVLTRSAPGTYSLVRELSADEKRQAASGAPRDTSPAAV